MTDEILDQSIAMDIMYGNSPRDMMSRALQNEKLIKIVNQLRIIRNSTEYIESNFRSILEKEMNMFTTIGHYTAYMTVLHSLSKERAKILINEINAQLDQYNFLKMINDEFLKMLNNEFLK